MDRREGSVEPAEPPIFGSVSGSESQLLPSYKSICIAEPPLAEPSQQNMCNCNSRFDSWDSLYLGAREGRVYLGQ